MQTNKFLIILCLCSFAAVKGGVEQDALDEHNRLRAKHGVDPLTLSADLCNQAYNYALHLVLLNSLVHSNSRGKYGENLCFTTSYPQDCTQSWYNEIKDYDFDNGEFSEKTAHFTQLIWADSTEMGYGQAQAENGDYYVVAMYTPPGNVKGAYERNVPKVKKEKSSAIAVSTNTVLISILYGLIKLLY